MLAFVEIESLADCKIEWHLQRKQTHFKGVWGGAACGYALCARDPKQKISPEHFIRTRREQLCGPQKWYHLFRAPNQYTGRTNIKSLAKRNKSATSRFTTGQSCNEYIFQSQCAEKIDFRSESSLARVDNGIGSAPEFGLAVCLFRPVADTAHYSLSLRLDYKAG